MAIKLCKLSDLCFSRIADIDGEFGAVLVSLFEDFPVNDADLAGKGGGRCLLGPVALISLLILLFRGGGDSGGLRDLTVRTSFSVDPSIPIVIL